MHFPLVIVPVARRAGWDLISRSVGPCLPTLRARAPDPQKQKQMARSAGKFSGYPVSLPCRSRVVPCRRPVCVSLPCRPVSWLRRTVLNPKRRTDPCKLVMTPGWHEARRHNGFKCVITKAIRVWTIVKMCVFVPKIEIAPPVACSEASDVYAECFVSPGPWAPCVFCFLFLPAYLPTLRRRAAN